MILLRLINVFQLYAVPKRETNNTCVGPVILLQKNSVFEQWVHFNYKSKKTTSTPIIHTFTYAYFNNLNF
jgi:hypothetical protein